MEYFISYFAAGFLLAIAATLHGTFTRNKLSLFVFTVFLWPLLVIVTPNLFLNTDHRLINDSDTEQRILRGEISTLAKETTAYLNEEERKRLDKVAIASDSSLTFFGNTFDFEDLLSKFWDLNVPPEIYQSFRYAQRRLEENNSPEIQVRFSRSEPDWFIGFSHEFVKSIAKADRKKQGRILEAIGKIAAAPIEVCGDTIKPLTADLTGLWRCRIGDDRLIYYPNIQTKQIVLISFGARGDVYQS